MDAGSGPTAGPLAAVTMEQPDDGRTLWTDEFPAEASGEESLAPATDEAVFGAAKATDDPPGQAGATFLRDEVEQLAPLPSSRRLAGTALGAGLLIIAGGAWLWYPPMTGQPPARPMAPLESTAQVVAERDPVAELEPVALPGQGTLPDPVNTPPLEGSPVAEPEPVSVVRAPKAPQPVPPLPADLPSPELPDKPATLSPIASSTPGPLVTVDADITVVLLDAAGRRHEPRAARPGSYKVVAFFADGQANSQGEVVLVEGKTARIMCRRSAEVCRVTH